MKRFVQLFDTILEFMTEHNLPLHNKILESKPDIFYLSDSFEKLNAVNKQLQGKNANLITCKEAVTAFIKKLDLLCFYMKRQELRHFPTLGQIKSSLKDGDFKVFLDHLENLGEEMKVRFQDVLQMNVPAWVLQPFQTSPIEVDETIQDSIIELQSSESLKLKYEKGLHVLWASSELVGKFPTLWEKVKLFFVAFPTSNLVETGFSKVSHILTKQRNRLEIDVRGDLRLSLTNLEPDIKKLVEKVVH